MSDTDNKIKIELNTRKDVLNQHLAKFNQLKNEGRWSEAWNQLLITLNYANETLKYSAALLKNISYKMPQVNTEQQKNFADSHEQTLENKHSPQKANKYAKKMIVVPKKQNIH